jgi:hypothetical protein
MNKTFALLSTATLLLIGIGCGSSESDDGDASIARDARPGTGGAPGTGGSAGFGGTSGGMDGGLTAGTGGMLGTGGALASGGVLGSGGMLASGGMLGSGGVPTGGVPTGGSTAGTGGTVIDGGPAPIDGPTTQICGGIAGLPCPKEQFCEYAAGACSSIADATGICTTPTQVCPAVYQPVCDCNGKTYGNDCERRGAGVSKVADGECSSTGKLCGGIAGLPCAKGQFCDYAVGGCGTMPDGAGTCAATGADIACDKIYQPVCGCNGKTYGNDCERRAAGIPKLSDGTCPIVDAGTRG